MENLYKISISGVEADTPVVTATIEVSSEGARIAEVRVEMGVLEPIHPGLGTVDFALLVRTAALMISPGEPPAAASPLVGLKESPQRVDATVEGVQMTVDAANSFQSTRSAPKDNSGRTNKTDMPSDFGVTYWRLGSLAKVSKHYDVPRHIAQEWIKLLQKEGKVASPWPKKGNRSFR